MVQSEQMPSTGEFEEMQVHMHVLVHVHVLDSCCIRIQYLHGTVHTLRLYHLGAVIIHFTAHRLIWHSNERRRTNQRPQQNLLSMVQCTMYILCLHQTDQPLFSVDTAGITLCCAKQQLVVCNSVSGGIYCRKAYTCSCLYAQMYMCSLTGQCII